MDLSIYQVIRGPVLSSKAFKLNQAFKKLTLEVHPKATKSQIKDALYKIFKISAKKIHTISRQGKIKRVRGSETQRVFRKRAIITLSADQNIDTLSQVNIAQQLTQQS